MQKHFGCMYKFALVLLLGGCGSHYAAIPDVLTFCDLDNHKPKPPRRIANITVAYNELELSREAIMQERDDCNSKRTVLVQLLKERK